MTDLITWVLIGLGSWLAVALAAYGVYQFWLWWNIDAESQVILAMLERGQELDSDEDQRNAELNAWLYALDRALTLPGYWELYAPPVDIEELFRQERLIENYATTPGRAVTGRREPSGGYAPGGAITRLPRVPSGPAPGSGPRGYPNRPRP